MHELQSLLLKKLPRLGELTFWCEVIVEWEKWIVTNSDSYWADILFPSHINQWWFAYWRRTINRIEILWHPFTHADILEALGEDWAMTGDYQIMRKQWLWGQEFEWLYYKVDAVWELENYPKLPSNISDLSLPEYEETRDRLIQLLTK